VEDSELEKFEVQDNKIVRGVESYYQSRFNIQDRFHSKKFEEIVVKYIEGLEFYCQYYYKGLPSWSWYYPFHYTPLLCDVDDYITHNKIQVQLKRDDPYDPILALMFMFPKQNFGLLPKPVAEKLLDPKCILRSPVDYFPAKFELDKFETLKYNKHALIPFLN
jgi:5'-3' exonuclease